MNENNTPWSKRLLLIVKVIEVRLRFILILVATALLIGYWDTIKNYWDKWTRPAASAASQLPANKEFYCPMHPKVIRDGYEPNGDVPKCPICGMPLSLRTKGETEPLPAGITARVQLSPERIQLAGVETVEVQYHPLTQQISTVGTVTFDESRLSRVVSRVSGYVEKLYVDQTFIKVKRGDELAAIYSPDLYSTAQEMLLAAKGNVAKDLADSARRRLKLFGVSDQEIDAILAAGAATPRLVIRSPQAGHVIRKNVVVGSRVEDGTALLEIADLSDLWIEADVYEKDISLLHEGQAIEATVEALPHRVFTGKLALVYPQLDTATRTNRVRFQVANPDGELRPGMFAAVRINIPLSHRERAGVRGNGDEHGDADSASSGAPPSPASHSQPTSSQSLPSPQPSPGGRGGDEVLTVPERAVIDTGTKQIVYVQRKPGMFEGIEVQLGPRSGDLYPVLKGLKAGDRVAAAGAFLIDAETRLNPAAASTYFGASGGPQASHDAAKPQTAPTGTPTKTQLPAKEPDAEATTEGPKPLSQESLDNIAKLPEADRASAIAQAACPITGEPLGSMGVPHKLILKGQAVFLCCAGCVDEATKNADKILATVAKFKAATAARKGKK